MRKCSDKDRDPAQTDREPLQKVHNRVRPMPDLQAPEHLAREGRKDEAMDPAVPRLQVQAHRTHHQGL